MFQRQLHIISRRLFRTVTYNPHLNSSSYLLQRHIIRRFAMQTVNVPNMGDSITEGTLVEWTKNVGDFCNVDDIVAVIETDKVSIDIRTDNAGKITKQLANIDDTLEVNSPLFEIDTDASGAPSQAQTQPQTQTEPPKEAPKTETKEAPTETKAPPTPTPALNTKAPSTTPPPPPAPSASAIMDRSQNRVQMSRMRQRISERLMEAQSGTASLTTFNEIDMSNIMALRNKYKDEFLEKHGVKLGFMSAFVKASTSALQYMPAVNAYIDGKDVVYNNFCDVSVAVASPTGLVVPVIRNANTLTFAEVEKEIGIYAKKAKDGTLALHEMSGGTFTISNGGVFGSLFGTPIINPPQSAILGMHGTFERPMAVNGQVQIRPMMYIALTYDHRIIDGRESVLFLKHIKQCVEDPSKLLFNI